MFFNKLFQSKSIVKNIIIGGSIGTVLSFQSQQLEKQRFQQYHNIKVNIDDDSYVSENDIETTISKAFFYTKMAKESNLKIFAGSASRELGKEIAAQLDINLARSKIIKCENSEILIDIQENISRQTVYVIQSMSPPNISDNFMELIFLISQLKRQGAQKVVAIIPYLAYGRQTQTQLVDTVDQDRFSFLSASICQLLETAGCDTIITVNFNKRALKGFFSSNIPCLNIEIEELLLPYMFNKDLKDPVLVGSSSQNTRVKKLSKLKDEFEKYDIPVGLGLFAQYGNDFEYLGSSVNGQDCIVISDMIDTGTNMINQSSILKELGAKDIYYFAPHGIFSKDSYKKVKSQNIKELIVTNTIQNDSLNYPKIHHLSVGKLLSEIISLLHQGVSVNELREQNSLFKNKQLPKSLKYQQL